MDRDALVPVVAGSAAVIVVTSLVSGTLEHGLALPVVYADAASNGGMALVLVGIMLLYEALSYEDYRTKGPVHIGTDAALVFIAAAVVTLVVVSGFDLAGLGNLSGEVAGVVFDAGNVLAALAGFAVAAALFFARNRDCYRPPNADRRPST
jgi:peptidoglycan biosynthesis protein MviN/MurJ (putative lipid II flippase)